MILENGETQYNTITRNLDHNLIEKIKLYSKEYISTEDNKVTLGTGIYKIKNGVYISIGNKGQDKTTTEASKIRSWVNKFKRQSIGATISYKDRIAYEIRVHNNKANDDICKLMHKLRLSITTHSHLNRCITTDYIRGLAKHL